MGLPVIRTGNTALDKFLSLVREHIESDKSKGGARFLRESDITTIIEKTTDAIAKSPKSFSQQEMEKFANDIRNTALFRALLGPGSALDGRVDGLPRTTLSDIRAGQADTAAGVTSEAIVSAEDSRSVAALVTTVTARLDNFDGAATIEEAYLAIADATTGLEAQYTLKVTAGNKFAGIGLAATSPTAGVGTSAIIFAADKFALVGSSETIADPANPPLDRLPFGYDSATNTIYINGTVRINAGGPTINDGIEGPPGDDGAPGSPGADGVRGSRTLYASGSSWSDSTANSAITSATGSSTKVIGDTVTISNGTNFAGTKYWSGSAWVDPGVVIDGNLLVTGTISGGKIATNSLTTDKLQVTGSAVIFNQPVSLNTTGNLISSTTFSGTSTVTGSLWTVQTTQWNFSSSTAVSFGRTGVTPFTVASTTQVNNLNAQYVGGFQKTNLCSLIACQSGTATASGDGFNFYVSGIAGVSSVGASGGSNYFGVVNTSDERLKQDIEDEVMGLDFIRALRPVTYRMRAEPEMRYHGFIAQDVEPLLDGRLDDSLFQTRPETGMHGVDYMSVVAPLVLAVQQLERRVRQLEEQHS